MKKKLTKKQIMKGCDDIRARFNRTIPVSLMVSEADMSTLQRRYFKTPNLSPEELIDIAIYELTRTQAREDFLRLISKEK
jgi:hypothetical protein